MEIRDLRQKEKLIIDDEYLNGYAKLCGINASGVYMALCRHADKDQTCFPSKKLIAKELSISERSVYTALKTLSEWNIIEITNQGRKDDGSFRNNIYSLIDKKYWKNKPQANGAVGKKRHSPQANDDIHRRQLLPNKETHIKETHKKESDFKKSLAPSLVYEEPDKDTYKTKSKIYAKLGIEYKPPKRTTAQERAWNTEQLARYLKEKVMEMHGVDVYINKTKSGKHWKAMTRIIKDFSLSECKQMIDFYLDSEKFDKFGVDPSTIFSDHSINAFLKGDKQNREPLQQVGKYKFYTKEEIAEARDKGLIKWDNNKWIINN